MTWENVLKEDPYREEDIKRIMAEKGVTAQEAGEIYEKNIRDVKGSSDPKPSFGWNLSMFKGKSWNKKLEQLLKQPGLETITSSAIEDAAQTSIDILLALTGEDSFFETEGKDYMAEQVGHIFNEIVQDLATTIHKSIDSEMFAEEIEEEIDEMLEDKRLDDAEVDAIWGEYGVKNVCEKSITNVIKMLADLISTNTDSGPLSDSELNQVKNKIMESKALKEFCAHAYVLLVIKISSGMHMYSGSEKEQAMGDMLTPDEEKFIEDNTEEHEMGPFKVSGVSGIDPRTGIPKTDVVIDEEARRKYFEEEERENKSFAKAWDIIKGNCRRCKNRKRGILYSYW